MSKLFELISEARANVDAISEKSKSCPTGHYTAFYLGDSGYTCGHIQVGHDTRDGSIGFGSKPLNREEVGGHIAEYKNLLL